MGTGSAMTHANAVKVGPTLIHEMHDYKTKIHTDKV